MLGSCDKTRPSIDVATSVFALHAYLVFVTEHRHPVFAAAQPDRMEEIMGAVCGDFGCELSKFNGEANTFTCSSPSPDGGAVPGGQ
jgi:hypothetical protein